MTKAPASFAQDTVDDLDLEPVIRELKATVEKGGYDWPEKSAREAATQYLAFLKSTREVLLSKVACDVQISPPSKVVDIFWHTHILFTQKYFQDCDAVFGHYLHHEPVLQDE